MVLHPMDDERRDYAAKVLRTKILHPVFEDEIRTMLAALAGAGKIRVREQPPEVFQYHGSGMRDHFVAEFDKGRAIAGGRTKGGALARLLAVLLEGNFFPQT